MTQRDCKKPAFYRRRLGQHSLHRKLGCAVSLVLIMGGCFCFVLLVQPRQAHACFQPTHVPHNQHHASSSSSSSTSRSSLSQLEVSCSTSDFVSPQSQISETEADYQLYVFTPGVLAKNLQVDVDPTKRMVRVLAKRDGDDNGQPNKEQIQRIADDAGGAPAPAASASVCYIQQWHVPESVHLPDLVMAYGNGVLTLSIPKQQHEDVTTPPLTITTSVFSKGERLSPQGTNSLPKGVSSGRQHSNTNKQHTKPRRGSFPFPKGTVTSKQARYGDDAFPVNSMMIADTKESFEPRTMSETSSATDSAPRPRTHHSIRGGATQGDTRQHVVVVLKQSAASGGLSYKKATLDTSPSASSFSTEGTTAVAHGVLGVEIPDPIKKHVYSRISSRVSAEEAEYWFNKL